MRQAFEGEAASLSFVGKYGEKYGRQTKGTGRGWAT
jgi:hypothetical protein